MLRSVQICHIAVVCVGALSLAACDASADLASERAHDEATGVAAKSLVQCNGPYPFDATPLMGAKGRALLYGATRAELTKDPPLRSLAQGGSFWFFLETEEETLVDVRVKVSGDLRRTDEPKRACWSYAGRAATQLELVANDQGQGSIEVLVDGASYDRFDFDIRRPGSLEIDWQADLGQGQAVLRDEGGQRLFALRGITWEVAPTKRPALKEGAKGPFLTWDGDIDQVLYMGFFGELSASLELVVDPATGRFTERTKK